MNTEKKIQIPAIVEGISALKDGGVSIRLHTNEMTPAEKTVLLEFHQKFGYFLFKESPFQESDLPKDTPQRDIKSPSARLRAVFFILWKQNDQSKPFQEFYGREMEKLIEHYKAKLT